MGGHGRTGHDRAGVPFRRLSQDIAGENVRESLSIHQHISANISTDQQSPAFASLFLGRIRFPAARVPSRARLPHPSTSRHLASVCIDMGWRREQKPGGDDMEVEGPRFGRVSRGVKSERNFQDGLCAACCQSVGRDGYKQYRAWHEERACYMNYWLCGACRKWTNKNVWREIEKHEPHLTEAQQYERADLDWYYAVVSIVKDRCERGLLPYEWVWDEVVLG